MGVFSSIVGRSFDRVHPVFVFLGNTGFRIILLSALLCLLCNYSRGQTVEWTWVSGSSSANTKGTYGTKGTASSSNQPGAREGATKFIDSNGDLWIFGGYGYGTGSTKGYLNDLWKYDVSADEWTWVSGEDDIDNPGVFGTKGTASSSNMPGSIHHCASWVDSNDDLWIFGGYGYGNSTRTYSNTTWKYDVSADEWTWVAGAAGTNDKGTYGTIDVAATSNTPGARDGAVFWKDDDGDFWLFGGNGRGASGSVGKLNDLWLFDVSAQKWIWKDGSSSIGQQGSYGIKGEATTSKIPGGRSTGASVKGADGNLWLYGGSGFDGIASGGSGTLNDLWKYYPSSDIWNWFHGNNTANHSHTYGTIGVPNSNNTPGDRYHSPVSWVDAEDNFYLYGGLGYSSRRYGDLWKWDGTNWTWISGSSSNGPSAVHGTKGTASTSNFPGYRQKSLGWTDADGSNWLFGGETSSSNLYNDLWKYTLIYKIENGGYNEESRSELTLSSGESSGDALQDAGDWIKITDYRGNSNELTTKLPASSNVAVRWNRRWQIKRNDVNSNGGTFKMKFDLDSPPSADRSYYLLHRAGSNPFIIHTEASYEQSGNSVIFTLDLGDISHTHEYTVGWSDEDAGYALDFEKATTADQVNLPINLDASASDFTIECWVKPSAISNTQTIIDQNTGTGTPRTVLSIRSDGTLGTKLGNVNNGSTRTLTANKWYHTAITYDGSTVKLYLDGKLEKSVSVTAEGCDGTWIMGANRNGLSALDGQIDEMRIWNDVRTESEIRKNMHHALAGSESNLLAYYKFDQVSSSFLPDVSANNNSGTLSNFALSGSSSNWVESSAPIVAAANAHQVAGPGNGLEFDGTDDHISVSNFLDPSSSSWSVEGWFNSDITSTSVLMAQVNGSSSSIGRTYFRIANGKLETYLGGSKITGTTSLSTDEWYHVALTYDGTTLKLYLNGLLELSKTMTIPTCDGDLVIGASKGLTVHFDGKMDEWRFWSTTRTQAELQDNMYASLDEGDTGLLAYYDFDSYTGTTLTDLTSHSNDGTLNNFPTTCWVSATTREPYKTIKAGTHGSGSTWKNGNAPSSSSDRMAIFHDVALNTSGTYKRLHVNSGVDLTASADVTVTGDVIVNGTLTGSNKLILNGSTRQCLGGSGSLGALQVNNGNDISLEGDLTLTGALSLTNGDIEINDHTLTLSGTTSHGSSSSYLKLNGSGSVKTTVGSSPVILPVGRNPYLPIIIDDGGGAEFTVGVADKVYDNPMAQTTELTTNCVSETWTVQASQSASNVSIQVGWEAAEETTGFSRSKCAVATWEHGVSSSWAQGVNGASTGSGPYFQTTTMGSMSTNLYYFGVGSVGSPLPVELTQFDALWQAKDRSVLLVWETSTEQNNSHFLIERKLGEQHWETIGRVDGHGTSLSPVQYSYTDYLQKVGSDRVLYYRLKQVDYNDDFAYSDIRTLQTSDENPLLLELYPNPANSQLHINASQPMDEVMIYNSLGHLIMTVYRSNTIDISNLPAGNYYLEARPKHLESPRNRCRFVVE